METRNRSAYERAARRTLAAFWNAESSLRVANGHSGLTTDPAYAKNRGVGLRQMTEGILAALGAECINMSLANWLLPAHAVLQAPAV